MADRQDAQIPDRVHLTGMIGTRIQNSAINRLLAMDVDRLLEGFRKRPGRQAWDGEHVGKWLHAATLAWVYTGNAELRAKLDTRRGGAYQVPTRRRLSGHLPAQGSLDRVGRLVAQVQSHRPDHLHALHGQHGAAGRPAAKWATCSATPSATGRANATSSRPASTWAWRPTSVLEPMVWLYRLTGEKKYGDFCQYILRAWEQPNGPHIVSRLLERKGVNKVGNGKAYEMLSCINGMLEWYRTTGDPRLSPGGAQRLGRHCGQATVYYRHGQRRRSLPRRL